MEASPTSGLKAIVLDGVNGENDNTVGKQGMKVAKGSHTGCEKADKDSEIVRMTRSPAATLWYSTGGKTNSASSF